MLPTTAPRHHIDIVTASSKYAILSALDQPLTHFQCANPSTRPLEIAAALVSIVATFLLFLLYVDRRNYIREIQNVQKTLTRLDAAITSIEAEIQSLKPSIFSADKEASKSRYILDTVSYGLQRLDQKVEHIKKLEKSTAKQRSTLISPDPAPSQIPPSTPYSRKPRPDNLKFKEGDYVQVTNDYKNNFGLVGAITDIDFPWVYIQTDTEVIKKHITSVKKA